MTREFYIVRGFIKRNGKFLMLRKVRAAVKENIGKWEVPGGKIEPGEDPKHAIIREVFEEIGLAVEIVKELTFLDIERDGIRSRAHVYLLEAEDSEPKLSSEHDEYKWVSSEEANKMDKVMFADLLIKYMKEAD